MTARFELTDAEWDLLQPLLPTDPPRGGRWQDHRTVISGILFRERTGIPWRDLPARFGNWKTVYQRKRRWALDGTWLLRDVRRERDGVVAGERGWVVLGPPVVSAGLWCSWCRFAAHSVVTSVTAVRVEDSSTMALSAA